MNLFTNVAIKSVKRNKNCDTYDISFAGSSVFTKSDLKYRKYTSKLAYLEIHTLTPAYLRQQTLTNQNKQRMQINFISL